MPAAALEKLKAWLSTYPHWEDFRLLPTREEETARQADLLGNTAVSSKYYVNLYWQMPGQGDAGEDAQRLTELQSWVREQSLLGFTPRLGDAPAREKIRTEKGGFTPGAQTVTYTVTLVVELVKEYPVR